MGFWSNLIGKKVHCTGCGIVLPVDPKNVGNEVYCSDACKANYLRLSTLPPPANADQPEGASGSNPTQ